MLRIAQLLHSEIVFFLIACFQEDLFEKPAENVLILFPSIIYQILLKATKHEFFVFFITDFSLSLSIGNNKPVFGSANSEMIVPPLFFF